MRFSNLFTLLLFCFSSFIFAQQYGNEGYGNNGYGRGGSGYNGTSQNTYSQPSSSEEKSPLEMVDALMIKLKPALILDGLQEVAIKQILLDDAKARGIVIKKENDEEAKFKEIQALNKKVDIQVLSILNDDQKEKYKEFKEDLKNPKKSKKKDKKSVE